MIDVYAFVVVFCGFIGAVLSGSKWAIAFTLATLILLAITIIRDRLPRSTL